MASTTNTVLIIGALGLGALLLFKSQLGQDLLGGGAGAGSAGGDTGTPGTTGIGGGVPGYYDNNGNFVPFFNPNAPNSQQDNTPQPTITATPIDTANAPIANNPFGITPHDIGFVAIGTAPFAAYGLYKGLRAFGGDWPNGMSGARRRAAEEDLARSTSERETGLPDRTSLREDPLRGGAAEARDVAYYRQYYDSKLAGQRAARMEQAAAELGAGAEKKSVFSRILTGEILEGAGGFGGLPTAPLPSFANAPTVPFGKGPNLTGIAINNISGALSRFFPARYPTSAPTAIPNPQPQRASPGPQHAMLGFMQNGRPTYQPAPYSNAAERFTVNQLNSRSKSSRGF